MPQPACGPWRRRSPARRCSSKNGRPTSADARRQPSSTDGARAGRGAEWIPWRPWPDSLPCKTGLAMCGKPGFPRPHPVALQFLLLLAFLADDALAGITDTLALVGLGTAILANLRRNLADDLLVDAVDHDLGRLRHGNRHAFGGLIDHVVAEAKSKLQVLALHGRTVA